MAPPPSSSTIDATCPLRAGPSAHGGDHGTSRSGQVGPGQVGSGQVGSGQAGPGQAGPGQAGPGRRGAGQDGSGHGGDRHAPAGRTAHHAEHHHHDHDHHHDDGHGHDHHHDLQGAPIRRLATALVLTAGFMVVEAAVGFWSGSLSLLADAGHMFADAGALGMAIAAQRIASRPRTAKQTYGFRRAEVLAAFINGVLLVGVALSVVVEAAHRLGGEHVVRGEAMGITAAGGLAINGIAAWVLSRGGRGNVNVRAALAHVISDAMGSVGALVAGLLVAFAGLTWADPVASVFIAALVAANAVRLVRETAHVLMQGSPPGVDCGAIDAAVRDIPGVLDVHDLHAWRISDGYDVLTVHVVVADAAAGTTVAREITALIQAEFGLSHVTVQPEVHEPGAGSAPRAATPPDPHPA